MTDQHALDDLAAFAAIEVVSGDLEPWADLLGALLVNDVVDRETALWLVKLYNAYDDLGSAWSVYARWPSPAAWAAAGDRDEAREYPCTQERRNLRGGLVLRHLESYVAHLGGSTQEAWLTSPLRGDDARADWLRLYAFVRRVWGVGRQTAFEWAEFCAKVAGLPVEAPSAELWESEGPRRSLQRIYGEAHPSAEWLDERADECRAWLTETGTPLAWVDFETVICDFNVMRDGRYYPGKHLAALREELYVAGEPVLHDVWHSIIPAPWNRIAPGIDADLLTRYRDTGEVLCSPL